MKRLLWILAALAAVAGGLWVAGRAPSRYVLETECRRMLDDRARREQALEREIARAAARGAPVADLRARLDEVYRAPERLERRGWEVVLIPPGGRRPDPAGFLDWGTHDASTPRDPPLLRGPVRIWLRPKGVLARLFSRAR